MDSHVAMDSIAVLYADQPVVYRGRRATFLHMNRGSAIIRYWGDSHAVAVPPEALLLQSTGGAKQSLPASDEPMSRDLAH